jgi:hypothetical protein
MRAAAEAILAFWPNRNPVDEAGTQSAKTSPEILQLGKVGQLPAVIRAEFGGRVHVERKSVCLIGRGVKFLTGMCR